MTWSITNMTWSITNKINVGFGVALGLMVLIGALAHQSTRQLVETLRLEIHTHKVLNELHDVLFELQTAETGQRGYIRGERVPRLLPVGDHADRDRAARAAAADR